MERDWALRKNKLQLWNYWKMKETKALTKYTGVNITQKQENIMEVLIKWVISVNNTQ